MGDVQYRGGYLDYRGGVQYRGGTQITKDLFPNGTDDISHVHHDISHIYHDIPTILNIHHGTQDIPPHASWYPHGTEHPHSTAHTLYRVVKVTGDSFTIS